MQLSWTWQTQMTGFMWKFSGMLQVYCAKGQLLKEIVTKVRVCVKVKGEFGELY